MGKLNYSARKISGVKAGHVVSKDLKKRMAPGSGSKAAARDPTLEIDLTRKNLTDDGFAEFIDDLINCINCRDEEHPFGLAKATELHLQGNKLTVQSLLKLGDVIASSAGDLRELDISRNDIRIVTEEEKAIWKSFLSSFKNCYMLKKLDLAGNPIGTLGLEILARSYIKSDLDFLEADAEAIVRQNHTFSTDVSDGEGAALAEETAVLKINVKATSDCKGARVKKSPSKVGRAARQNGVGSTAAPASKNITLSDLKQYACTRGLRSIPYFILSEIEVKNSSAVHLSRMLATQRASEQLLEFLPPGKASTIPGSARGDRSIIWKPNDGFTTYAKRLLDVTEVIRGYKARAQGGSEGNRSDDEDSTDEAAKRKSQSKLELDHTRLTKRVRIESLKQEGLRASEIATVALKMMVVSRALLLEDRDRAVEASEDEAADEELPIAEEYAEKEQEPERMEEEGHTEEELTVEHSPSSVEFHPLPQYTISTAFSSSFSKGRFHPGTELFDEEFPALQPVYRGSATPKAATPEPENKGCLEPNFPFDATPERSSFGAGNTSGHEFSSVQTVRPTGGKGNPRASVSQKGRKSSWRFGLPFNIWRRIISHAVGANGILDQEQQARILHYASDWDSVAYELTIKGAEDHQQIWKFLDTVRCFTYTPLN